MPSTAPRLPVVRVGAPACPAERRIPGTDRMVRCARRHLDPSVQTWHWTVLEDPSGLVSVGWGTPDVTVVSR